MVKRIARLPLVLLAAALAGCASRPVPYSLGTFARHAKANYAATTAQQEPVSHSIDLYQAMARALKYNLERRQAIAEARLRGAELNLANFSLLPTAAANAGYAARDNEQASSSLNILTDTLNYGASTSQDLGVKTSDITFGWNILDFGLSYVRARQAGDKYLISEENRLKVTQKLLDDVRSAYWRAVTFDHMLSRLQKIAGRAEKAQSMSREASASGETPRLEALLSERELLDIKRAIATLQRDLVTARAELAALINLRPGEDFTLAATVRQVLPAEPPHGLDDMMMIALRDRPELHENLYQRRINLDEARAALLSLLPGIRLYSGANWDSNSFLYNNNWVSWGATASWNLLQVFQYPARRKLLESQDKALKAQALALSMSIMTQVHLSRIRYQHFRKELAIAGEYRSVQKRLVTQYHAEVGAGRANEQQSLREELNLLIADAKYDLAYADLQSAYAALYSSIGWQPYVEADPRLGIDEVAAQLKASWIEAGKHEVSSVDADPDPPVDIKPAFRG